MKAFFKGSHDAKVAKVAKVEYDKSTEAAEFASIDKELKAAKYTGKAFEKGNIVTVSYEVADRAAYKKFLEVYKPAKVKAFAGKTEAREAAKREARAQKQVAAKEKEAAKKVAKPAAPKAEQKEAKAAAQKVTKPATAPKAPTKAAAKAPAAPAKKVEAKKA